ncbi:unnamed protein product [Closterium sp. Yama58-4]|nr:unnamed protein product [Closterium sp. Yama58-4]
MKHNHQSLHNHSQNHQRGESIVEEPNSILGDTTTITNGHAGNINGCADNTNGHAGSLNGCADNTNGHAGNTNGRADSALLEGAYGGGKGFTACQETGKGKARRVVQRKRPASSTSKFRGVTHHCRTGRWEAHIWEEGRQVYLGGFDSEKQAALMYDIAALKMRGEDAQTNLPPEEYTKYTKEIGGAHSAAAAPLAEAVLYDFHILRSPCFCCGTTLTSSCSPPFPHFVSSRGRS